MNKLFTIVSLILLAFVIENTGAFSQDAVQSISNDQEVSNVKPATDSNAQKKKPGAEKKNANKSSDKPDLQSANIKTLPGYQVELVYDVPLDSQGSWVALAVDPKGRLIASDQGKKGIFRIDVTDPKSPKVEKLPVDLSGAHGLLWKGDALYASVSGEGVYRVTDTDGDDQLDRANLLSKLDGSGEHGNHALLETENPDQMIVIAGNHTPLPAKQMSSLNRMQSYAEDMLLLRQWDPRGHARGIVAPGGWFTRFDLKKETHELFCMGFRNQYDAATNQAGDLFTYDSDMEWDLGLPWYRPTRICHVVSGGDFGWRSGSGNWPEYYEDSLPPVVNIGPGSPTGMLSGHGSRFPKKYQEAIYAFDWTYGRILAIHLKPNGASYSAEPELFVSGTPLPVTDGVIGQDGSLYFAMGGRGASATLVRVVYTGSESTAAIAKQPTLDAIPKEAILRRQLEQFHGVIDANALEAAWPHLSSSDRFLRNAARVAIESQPVERWSGRVASETNAQARIAGSVALARMGKPVHREGLIDGLLTLNFHTLPVEQQLGVLRALTLTFERLGKPTPEQRSRCMDAIDSVVPHPDSRVSHDAIRLLVYLESPSAVTKGMQLIVDRQPPAPLSWEGIEAMNARYGSALKRLQAKPTPLSAIDIAFTLRTATQGWTIDLRRQYFEFLNEAGKAGGGASYPGYLENTRDEALAFCTDRERTDLVDLTGQSFNPIPDFPITQPVGPGKEWTVAEALEGIGGKKLVGANFENGRNLFHATQCGACHRLQGLGGGVGPDLTSVPFKFDTPYLIEAIINPSKDVSDQYQSSNVLLDDGSVLSGIVIEQPDKSVVIYPSDPKAKSITVAREDIDKISPSKISQMPAGLINSLNKSELRNLTAYIMASGNAKHKNFEKPAKN